MFTSCYSIFMLNWLLQAVRTTLYQDTIQTGNIIKVSVVESININRYSKHNLIIYCIFPYPPVLAAIQEHNYVRKHTIPTLCNKQLENYEQLDVTCAEKESVRIKPF